MSNSTAGVPQELRLRALELMKVSRRIDDECKSLMSRGTAVPNYHSGTGQEAMSVGVGLAARREDYLLFTYRDFGMLLAKGVHLAELAGDLLLNSAGTTRGHGGIMHVSAPDRGIPGRNSVFGSRFGIAIGLAKAAQLRGEAKVVFCPFGEAEGARGVLYEALNMASLMKLPVLFVAENNGYSISSRTEDLFAAGVMSGMFRGGPVPTAMVDGNDVDAVYAATAAAATYCRSGLGPFFLECKTYRIDPHIPADEATYRTEDEVARWREKDPIPRFEDVLVQEGALSRDGVQALGQRADEAVSAGFAEALGAGEPDLSSMYDYLYYRDGAWASSVGVQRV